MRHNDISLRKYADLVHGGKVLGYRFTSGFLREYIDIPLAQVTEIFGKNAEEINETIKSTYVFKEIHPFFNKTRNISFFMNDEKKRINVDENMKPLKVWDKTINIHRAGFTLQLPVKDSALILKLAEMVDGMLYGTDFQEAFSIMSIKYVDVYPETLEGGKFGIKLGDGVYGWAYMWSSFEVSKITEEEIRKEFEIWCEDNNIKGVQLGVHPLKNIYEIQLHFSLNTSDSLEDTNIFARGCAIPSFVHSAVYKQKNKQTETVNEVLPFHNPGEYSYPDRTIFFTNNGIAYNLFDEKKYFVTTEDELSQKSIDFSKYSYTFARIIARDGELYELDMAKAGNWCKANITGGIPNFLRVMNKVCTESFLAEIIVGKQSNLPRVEVVDSKNGSIVIKKDIDLEQFGALPHEEIFAEVKEAWIEQIYGWSAWGWKKDIKNLVPEIIFAENNITFKVNIAL